ncbi:hypothetical protein ERJ75_000021400 [Trypanosoma vivax]|nr:hypothetical protein ERJ75_000021400 [Trypanosoma vivax]
MALIRSLRAMGVGLSPNLCFDISDVGTSPFRLSAAVNIPMERTLVAVPETAVWTVATIHDSDTDGLMPSIETCRDAFPQNQAEKLFDVFYLSLFFSINACRTHTPWATWQTKLATSTPCESNIVHIATDFLRNLSRHSLAPPHSLFLHMCSYTLCHACRLSEDRTKHDPATGTVLAVMPLVDAVINSGSDVANTTLQHIDVKQIQALLKKDPLQLLRQRLRSRSKNTAYWVLKASQPITAGERVNLR